MKKPAHILTLLMFLGLGTALYAQTTDIKGEIVRFDSYYKSYEPMANIKVDLLKEQKQVGSTYTNSKGIYYLYKLMPGAYVLHFKGKSFPIDVKPATGQFQEMEKIILQ